MTHSGQELLSKVVTALLKQEDKPRLLTILRNLNSKQEYAPIAQALLSELLPRFTPVPELKEALQVLQFYSQKHLERQERGLKKAFYPQYVLSQMTLEEELKEIEKGEVPKYVENRTKASVTAK